MKSKNLDKHKNVMTKLSVMIVMTLFAILGSTLFLQAQINVGVAIAGLNHDTPDGFTLIALEDIDASNTQKIFFTDMSYIAATNTYDNDASSNEGAIQITWTGTWTKGTLIEFKKTSVSPDPLAFEVSVSANGPAGAGASVVYAGDNFSMSNEGLSVFSSSSTTAPHANINLIYSFIQLQTCAPASCNDIDPGLDVDCPCSDDFASIYFTGSDDFVSYKDSERANPFTVASFETAANWDLASTNMPLSIVEYGDIQVGSSSSSPTVFWQDDFEATTPEMGGGTRLSSVGNATDGTFCGSDRFVRADNIVDGSCTGCGTAWTGASGSWVWGGEDLDGTAPCSNQIQTITWSGIDITGRSNLEFIGLFGIRSTTSWETTDQLKIEYQIDGGPVMGGYCFSPTMGSSASELNLALDEDCDLTVDGIDLSIVLSEHSFSIPATGSTMVIIFTANVDGSGEDFVVDNFRLAEGTAPALPEIDITGQGMSIPDGDTSPIPGDDTDFGTIAVGSDDTHTFTIKNTGAGALTLDGSPLVAVSGTNASDFSVEVMPTSPVAATTGTTTFQVKFTPGATGARMATLTIESDDADEDPYTFDVQGTGAVCTAPAITNVTASPTAICVGGTITLTVTGTLGSSANWQWYSGNCGGAPVGTGTSVMVSPVTTTAYYVRGEGNCVGTTASCTSITPPVQPDPSISISGATTICAGESTTLSYSSNGGISPCVNQWEISSTSAAAGFSPIGGATSSSYNTGALTGTRWYRVERSCTPSSCNTAISNVVEVTVAPSETDVALDGSGNLDITDVATSSDDVINLSASGMDLQVDDTNLCITGTGTGVVQVDGNTVDVPMASLTGDLDVMGMGGTDELNINGTIVIGGAFMADCEKINCKDGSFINAAGGTTMTGTIAPGNSPGIMTILAPYTITCGSTLEIEMRSATAGIDGYDQIVVTGSDEINISGVNLILSDCYTPELGESFTIINNQTASPIVGHFSDLSEGAGLRYNGTDLKLSYIGGDGNDIVLTAVDNTATSYMNNKDLGVSLNAMAASNSINNCHE